MTSSLGPSGFLTNNPTFDLVITASEFVNDFSVSNVDVETAETSAFASSNGTVFTTALNYTEDGNHYLVIDANAASDMAGNQNTMSDIFEWTYDATSPTATILAAEGTSGFISNDDIIRLTFITSETSDFGESSIETIGGNLNSFTSVDSTTYGANFVPSGGDGLKTISVNKDAFSDSATNTNEESVVFEWNFDSTSPTISIESETGSSGFISDHSNISLIFTTSEYTNDFVIHDVNVTGGGHVENFEGNGTVFTCVLVPYCCDKIVELNVLVKSGAFSDAATNLNIQSNVFAWKYDSSESKSFITSTEGIIVLACGGAAALVLLILAFYFMLPTGPVQSTSKPTDLTKYPQGDGIETTSSSNPLHTL